MVLKLRASGAHAAEYTIDNNNNGSRNIPLECYDLIASKSKGEQEQIYKILLEMDVYKNK